MRPPTNNWRQRRTQITKIRHAPSYKQLEVKTNINNINKTCALLQTTGGKDKHK